MVFALAACNTVQGAGRDVQEAGDAIEDAAD
ncbi:MULTISPECIES: entericidin A/B family lipoprotein [Glycocaulis]